MFIAYRIERKGTTPAGVEYLYVLLLLYTFNTSGIVLILSITLPCYTLLCFSANRLPVTVPPSLHRDVFCRHAYFYAKLVRLLFFLSEGWFGL